MMDLLIVRDLDVLIYVIVMFWTRVSSVPKRTLCVLLS